MQRLTIWQLEVNCFRYFGVGLFKVFVKEAKCPNNSMKVEAR